MRGAASSKHGGLIDKSVLTPYIDDLENWLYSEDYDKASLAGGWVKSGDNRRKTKRKR